MLDILTVMEDITEIKKLDKVLQELEIDILNNLETIENVLQELVLNGQMLQ